MLAVTWSDLTVAGAFIVGTAFGVLITVRVARVVAQFLTDLRRKHDEP